MPNMTRLRSRAWLAYVRSLPCLVCRTRRDVDAAHIGPHGLAQKASDDQTVPLCRTHHRELHEIGRRSFETRYNISFYAALERLQKKPLIRIEQGRFVGRIEGREYLLGSVGIGPKQALRHMLQFRREELREEEVQS